MSTVQPIARAERRVSPADVARAVPSLAVAADAQPLAHDLTGMLRILTCGSVDDGKSTLIGRLLWDASDLYDDQRATIERSGRTAGGTTNPDFSLLVDGLVAEREQGITIDIAWRYFDTESRRYVIIDSPGHEQYTRNMASGASHADVAIMLIDARHGIKNQTKRHAAILDLVGLKRVVLAVNKMDLVGWSEEVFRKIDAEFRAITSEFNFVEAITIPVSAALGDNVARRSENMSWYAGPHLLEHLDSLADKVLAASGPFRFPVQTVVRDGQDFRGLAGTVSSGVVRVGDEVVDAVSGRSGNIQRIVTMSGDLREASQGQAIVLQLDRDLDISRGAVLAGADLRPAVAREIEACIVWLGDKPLDTDHGYLLRTATDLVPVASLELVARLDLETMTQHAIGLCAVNDIARVRVALGRPAAVDIFAELPETGSFVLVDALTGGTVAGGVVLAASGGPVDEAEDDDGVFTLTRALLASGLCKDLGESGADRAEFRRRAGEAAVLLRSAGIVVKLDI